MDASGLEVYWLLPVFFFDMGMGTSWNSYFKVIYYDFPLLSS